jgi:hypothetical protein
MADDPIRVLLAGLPISSMIPTPPGMVAILRSRVEDADGDLEAVSAWVVQHGGREGVTRPIQSQSLRRGQMTARTVPGEAYYVIPRTALKA